jgi:hypothetical protein
VSGTIWVGFEQKGNVQLNIGFDQNNDAREFFRYNTRGIWDTSAYKGAPMIRPMFGKLKKPNAIDNISITSTTFLAPNPASNTVQISNYPLQISKVEVYSIIGVKIDEKQCFDNHVQINVANYPSGIYFVRVTKENHAVETLKLIKN